MSVAENIFWVIENIFTVYIINWVFHIFFPGDYNKKTVALRICTYVFFYAIELIIAFGPVFSEVTIFFVDAVGCTLISITYKGDRKLKALILAVILLCEIISGRATFLIDAFFRIPHDNLINIIIFNILLAFFATILECHFRFESTAKSKIGITEMMLVVLISMAGLFLIVMILDTNYRTSEVVLGGACLVVIHLVLLFSVKQIKRNYGYEIENVLMERENEIYRHQLDIIAESERRTRELRHDMKNHLIAISKLAEDEGLNQIPEYIDSLINSTIVAGQFSNTGNIILDGIINMKLGEAKAAGVNLKVKIKVPDKIEIQPKDMVIVLGNLLDNSIRGACESDSGRFINFYMSMDRGKLLIEIENSYNGNLDERNGKLHSTKTEEKEHGLGIDSIRAVVERYNGDMLVEHDNEKFRVKIIMFA